MAEKVAPGIGAEPWMGISWTKWLEADAGVRRSNIRMWLSEETAEMIEGE